MGKFSIEDLKNKATSAAKQAVSDKIKGSTNDIITKLFEPKKEPSEEAPAQIPDDTIVFDQSLDQMLERLPLGSVSKAITNNLHGINFRQARPIIPRAKESYGYTFFTRPQLNLSAKNVTNHSAFYGLLNENNLSYQRFVRMMLDPRLCYGEEKLKSTIVDNHNAFISVLSNDVESVSGWPDMQVPTYTSDAGLYGEEISFTDGVSNHYETYDLDVTFRNSKGNPLIYMFWIWVKYQTAVFEGIFDPYPDFVAESEIDYNTRIYRLILDEHRRYVSYIACTGASFPTNVPIGNMFDYSLDKPVNTNNREISIRFRSNGFIVFEDLIKLKFNETQAIFNPEIRKLLKHDLKGNRASQGVLREDPMQDYSPDGLSLVKLPYGLRNSFDDSISDAIVSLANNKAYPYINLYTNELEWWVDKSYFNIAEELLPDATVKNRNSKVKGIPDDLDKLDIAKEAFKKLRKN